MNEQKMELQETIHMANGQYLLESPMQMGLNWIYTQRIESLVCHNFRCVFH